MKITPQQARAAFYQAAANIEARPELYDFTKPSVGKMDCPACMWGHVGRALEMGSDVINGEVANELGFHDPEYGAMGDTSVIYLMGFHHPESSNFHFKPSHAAARLRAFADHHWPADSITPVRPDLTECGQSFVELMRSFGSEVAA